MKRKKHPKDRKDGKRLIAEEACNGYYFCGHVGRLSNARKASRKKKNRRLRQKHKSLVKKEKWDDVAKTKKTVLWDIL